MCVQFWNRYLHSVAEISSSCDGHHGEQSSSRPDVQDDDLLAARFDSGHGRSYALQVFLILEAEMFSRVRAESSAVKRLLGFDVNVSW